MSHSFALVKIILSIGGILLKDIKIAIEVDKYTIYSTDWTIVVKFSKSFAGNHWLLTKQTVKKIEFPWK